MRAFTSSLRGVVGLAMVVAGRAHAQMASAPATPWRDEAAAVGTSARVLIIGAHPDDEDNALIAWLSMGRHVETAYLSLTRGENGVNSTGREREILLGMVRTAELLAERKRDGAHQYFTRAYDFGHAKNDSVVWAGWPRDSLVRDVVTVMRAFRPHVVISLFSGDTTDRDGQHQAAGELARQAYSLAADTIRFPARLSSGAGAWTIGALYQRVDSGGAAVVRVNVGELDRNRKRSYAEIGTEIRQLQRTQAVPTAAPIGTTYRYLRRDSVRTNGDNGEHEVPSSASLFFASDTSWTRFASLPLSTSIREDIASIVTATSAMAEHALTDSDDAAILRLAGVVRATTRARDSLQCADGTDLLCRGLEGDLALALAATKARAVRALLDASGIIIDVTAERETVAAGDSTRVTASVYNGGKTPVTVTRVAVSGGNIFAFTDRSEVVVASDSVARWTRSVRAYGATHPWWLMNGLVSGTWIFDIGLHGATVNGRLVASEDRQLPTSAEIGLRIGNAEVNTTVGPIVARADIALRGDDRHPLVAVPRLSVLLERSREYARASVPFERLYRVWVGSALAREDTVRVTIDLPPGLSTDSAARSVVLPPFGGRNLFFRVRGRWPIGGFRLSARVTPIATRSGATQAAVREFGANGAVFDGLVSFEYPHIPTQWFPVLAADSVFAMDLRLPPTLRVAYIRANRNDQLDARLAEMGVEVIPIDPLALAVADLSIYSTILIAPRAYAEVEALQANASVVRRFAERGGTVVVLFGRDELLLPGVLPYPIAFNSPPLDAITALDPEAPIQMSSPRSSLLEWPNRITSADFDHWAGARARELPAAFDAHYQHAVAMNDDHDRPTDAAILSARVGKGMFIYTGLAFDRQLTATNTGAARLLVNLLSASARPKP